MKKSDDPVVDASSRSSVRPLSIYQKQSLIGTGLVLLLTSVVLVGWLLMNANHRADRALATLTAESLMSMIAQQVVTTRSLLDGIGRSESVIQVVSGGSSEVAARLVPEETLFVSLLPHVERFRLMPRPEAGDSSSGENISGDNTSGKNGGDETLGFSSRQLVRQVLAGEDARPVAVKQGDQWLLEMAAPVAGQDGRPAGVVLAGFNLALIDEVVRGFDAAEGSLKLVQQLEGKPPVAIWGEAETDGIVVDDDRLPGWQLHLDQASQASIHLFELLVSLMILAGGLVLLSIVGAAPWQRFRQCLLTDSRALGSFISQLLSGSVQVNVPSLSTESFQELAGQLKQQALRERNATGNEEAVETASQKVLDDWATGGASSSRSAARQSREPTKEHTAPGAIPQTIFRAYDIRGVVGETLTDEVVYHLGRAFGSEADFQGQRTVCVGYDGRLSSPELAETLIRGLKESGRKVINVGQVPTPVLYFATHYFASETGIMVTGSHNPPDYNGFKMVMAGTTLAEQGIQDLYQRIIRQDYVSARGQVVREDVRPAYLERIAEDIVVPSPLKVVVDAGNGVAGELGPRVIEELGCEVIPLFCDIDGHFPNHHPDPGNPANLEDLIAAVRQHRADIGIAFDGDGDRIGLVTGVGEIVYPDRLLMLLASDVASRNPGTDIIFDVKCSRHLPEVIRRHGGRPLMWKTGHSLVKAKMKETGALLAGEMSGHVFYKERWYGFDDGIYTAARLLEILGLSGRSIEAMLEEFPKDVSTPEINIPVTDESKFSLVEALSDTLSVAGGKVATIDGIRVDFPDGWGLCRASNTTPVLVLRFEADNQEALERIQQIFQAGLQKLDPALRIPPR